MNGHITLAFQGDLRAFALDKTSTSIGNSPSADLQLAAKGIESLHATLAWEPRASSWLLSAGSPSAQKTLRLNGQLLSSVASLEDGDIIEMPDVLIRFGLTPMTPRFRGVETNEVVLRGLNKLTLGRATGEQTADPKVELDSEDARVSRQHLELDQTEPGVVFVTDKSQTGTLLNGQRFDRRQLIVGDRLKLGSYTFEFTGTSLRRVSAFGGAKVEARNLTFTLQNGRNILNQISLDISPCSFVGILGGSGQGKSTLMNALCGVNPATSGESYINGVKLGDSRQMAAAGIGYVPQDDIVHLELTVTEAITYSARLKLPSGTPRKAIRDLVEETIERLGLAEHKEKSISMLSGGQRKRVSIATELLAKPSVLFLDEPSSGLDPKTEFDLMSLLRRLAGTDCTVICTTHVLGRAYLFDQLLFVHGGHIIFNGTPDEAVDYFKVENGLEEIYLKVGGDETRTGANWRDEFEASRPAAKPLAYLPPAQEDTTQQVKPKRGPGWLPTLIIQLQRQWSILRADLLNLLFLLAQPILIGLLVGWVADDAVLRTFLCVVATLWFGCSNGAQQIVREISIFRRERVCGLGLNAYLQSKYVFFAIVTTLQALLLYLVTLTTAHIINPSDFNSTKYMEVMTTRLTPAPTAAPGVAAATTSVQAQVDEFDIVTEDTKGKEEAAPAATAAPAAEVPKPKGPGFLMTSLLRVANFFECGQNIMDTTDPGEGQPPSPDTKSKTLGIIFLVLLLKFSALFAAALVGVTIGLAISGLVRTSTQAVMWVPLVLIPQILFGGFVVTRPEMTPSVRFASEFVPSYCAQRMMDVAGIYGQITPRMTNRTKYPVFLTPTGEQEEVTWTELGESTTEKYDKVSDWNVSWQNLIVFPNRVGQHHNAFRIQRGVKKYDESTEQRNDVRYKMGTLYGFTAPAMTSATILGIWILACYGITIWGLIGKQKGK
ncbi:ABC-type multidrug transport system ATPase subunit [Roseimicrobium gellanilyticum]|uniref:ABC-type multidrug transport system ATPase subunit n=1 Tax=Roseimicrobium gellanilyticum TaxID=748857 RepID=A0A366HL51_9BACT|nr:ATP-binding cassette domain-containing protein [Roseimicrobium gellanilyticum]RBP43660.1 ABC-type multidrug transport system ATPase subunit [Roseimicrobium gellanilyticum]